MDTHKINIEKLQDFLVKLFSLCKISIVLIKDELVKLKDEVDEQKKLVNNICITVNDAWEKYNEDINVKFREQTQRLTVDHELELSDMKAALNDKDNIVSNLKKETDDIKLSHKKEIEKLENDHQNTRNLVEKTREELNSFDKKFKDLEVQKQKDIKEMQEKLHLEYKAEIESLRSR